MSFNQMTEEQKNKEEIRTAETKERSRNDSSSRVESRVKKRKESRVDMFKVFIILWLALLTGYILWKLPPNEVIDTWSSSPSPNLNNVHYEIDSKIPPIPPSITPIPKIPNFVPPAISPKFTIYLYNSKEVGKGRLLKENFHKNLTFDNIEIKILKYDKENGVFKDTNSNIVSQEKLKKSLNLFIFHATTHKLKGLWDEDVYDKLLTQSHGNCIWTVTKDSIQLDHAEPPLSPEGIVSGVNMFTDNQTKKTLQFHFTQNDMNRDKHNEINFSKLRKLITAKKESLE